MIRQQPRHVACLECLPLHSGHESYCVRTRKKEDLCSCLFAHTHNLTHTHLKTHEHNYTGIGWELVLHLWAPFSRRGKVSWFKWFANQPVLLFVSAKTNHPQLVFLSLICKDTHTHTHAQKGKSWTFLVQLFLSLLSFPSISFPFSFTLSLGYPIHFYFIRHQHSPTLISCSS